MKYEFVVSGERGEPFADTARVGCSNVSELMLLLLLLKVIVC